MYATKKSATIALPMSNVVCLSTATLLGTKRERRRLNVSAPTHEGRDAPKLEGVK